VPVGAVELVGILNIDKPRGWTSHDVVARVRRLAGQKRVGHAGTLDPAATGVLPVVLGRATRLVELIQAGHKTYRARVQLGAATATDDAEGELLARAAVPPLEHAQVEAALAQFRGEILQTPPRFAAIKVDGQRAYAVARRGGEPKLEPRQVTIYALHLLDLGPSSLHLEVTCSGGTYIRALARDLGAALGTLGHLTELVRTRVGPFCLEDAISLDHLAERGVESALLPADRALPDAPRFEATPDLAARLTNGVAVPANDLPSGPVWVTAPAGRLVCLGVSDGTLLRSRVLL
jgi:tRNA pseudouridine55 synthase